MKFNQETYDRLHAIVFSRSYPGYRPTVREIPNGDGKVDADKRYAHIAPKYLRAYGDTPLAHVLYEAYAEAYAEARSYATAAGFEPSYEHSALRVLEYPPGVGGHLHTDFDLFTLNLWRNQPDRMLDGWSSPARMHHGELAAVLSTGAVRATPHAILPSETTQYSLVFFAIPDHAAVLPTGITVGQWIAERVARSRTEAAK